MRRFMLILSVAALSGAAHADTSGDLKQAIAAFVAEEIEDASPEMHNAIAACILPVFTGIDDAMIAQVLAMDDFERGLGVVLTAYPEREQILEDCEELLD